MKSNIKIGDALASISSLVSLIFLASSLRAAAGAPVSTAFGPGDIAALRVQDNSGALTNISAQLFLDEYTTNGMLVQTIPVPTNGVRSLVVSGFSVAEATLTLSPDGRWLGFTGYNAPVGVTNIPNSSSTQYPRAIATMDVFGNFKIVSASTNFFDGTNIRGTVSDGTNSFWAFGAISGTTIGGLDYYGFDAVPGLIYSQNLRVANIINSNLYVCTAAGFGIYKFAGTPKSPATPMQIIYSGNSPYGFAINPSGNIAYIADDDAPTIGGVQRWTNAAGLPASWTLVYTLQTGVTNSGARGLAVDWSGPNPVIYASTSVTTVYGSAGNRLLRFVDSGSASPAVTLAVAATNSSFRGVAFVPQTIGPQSQIQALTPSGANTWLYWQGAGGSNYVVQGATNLGAASPFSDISPAITLPGSGVVGTNYLDAGALSNWPVRFYRIRSD